MTYRLGVDLGTTYSAAAIWEGGRAEIVALGDRSHAIPSVVYIAPDGSIVVGEPAQRRGQSDPAGMARHFKRRVGDPVPIIVQGAPCSVDMLLGRLLAHILDRVTQLQGGPPEKVFLTHPANWPAFKINVLEEAAKLAGLDSVGLLTEPQAAAIHYAQLERVEDGSVIAVYDLGGGTFDAAIVRKAGSRFELIGESSGIERLGGVDFDEAVLAHVVRELQPSTGELDASDPAVASALAQLNLERVAAKEDLSTQLSTDIPVLLPAHSTQVRLTRSEFERLIRPMLDQTVQALMRAIDSAGIEPSDLTATLLVGGSSRIPLVGELVANATGRPVNIDSHPKHAVSLGAAIAAGVDDTPPAPVRPRRTRGGTGDDVPAANREGGPPRGRLILAAVLAGLVAVAVIGIIVATSGGGGDGDGTAGSSTTEESSTTSGETEGSVTTGGTPSTSEATTTTAAPVVTDIREVEAHDVGPGPWTPVELDGGVWVPRRGGLTRIDLSTGAERDVTIVGRPETPTIADGALWVPNIAAGANRTTRVDPSEPENPRDVVTGSNGYTPAVTSSAVWVPDRGAGTITRIDRAEPFTATPVDITGGTVVAAAADGAGTEVWVSSPAGLFVVDDDLDPQPVTGVVPTGPPVVALGSVWVASNQQGTAELVRVDPATRTPFRLPMAAPVGALAAAEDALWVQVGTNLVPVDATGEVAGEPIEFDDETAALLVAPTDGALWVAARVQSPQTTDSSTTSAAADTAGPAVYHVDLATGVTTPFEVEGAPDTPLVVGDRVFVSVTGTGPVLELEAVLES